MGATGREMARCNPARWAGVACLGRPFPRGSDHIWCDLEGEERRFSAVIRLVLLCAGILQRTQNSCA